ncbi:putative protein phosphatase [Monocercomonoides exilis]|uniref:putative protein phosphatase n=1 Tax=Monocercomonoides exilis TaxID=2049356 RepID=UPI003559523B|nr:putative protein phosphatase [Monocercomonoides exilis]|eukprot:MONOS_12279.1-p1 / transcript=MONOS_12279.1 / gene=MONOS_12279 / organism=Monocercomonoides_exilis_PA203 / gene_product=protein phosphatase / transcript_product=protein phosphatase / location=Mono_scaffold00669:33859-35199(-) / protein_length=307 / sequence_SO=supercontig / SO=protein_coding / is_pseudo=false
MPFDLEKFIETAKKRQPLEEIDFLSLCDYVIEILLEEATVISLSTPINICGDIHGQLFDLFKLFKVGGPIPQQRYIFMGDYVDRGRYSLETLTFLLCLKARYPERITLLRGNHETRNISHSYGFFDDCMKQYGNLLPWTKSVEVFDCLPLAALIDETTLCVHGGLSPDVRTIDQIRLIPRRLEVPLKGPFADLLWSDPEASVESWGPSPRFCGYLFGYKVTKRFCDLNKISLICRAHQLVFGGYKYAFPEEQCLVTVWSAPNYSYVCGNVAAILQMFANEEKHFVLFSEEDEAKREIPKKITVDYFL